MWEAMGLCLQPILQVMSSIPFIKHQEQPVVLPSSRLPPMTPTATLDLDQLLATLSQNKAAWVATGTPERIKLLEACSSRLADKCQDIARVTVQAKGSYGQGLGEEMMGVWPCVMGLKEYSMALKAGGQHKPRKLYKAPGTEQMVAEVFPYGMMAALLPGHRGEVWMQPGQPATQGVLYRRKKAGEQIKGGVALVLGAGNQYPVVVLDIFHKLIVEDEVVLVKMSPVNEYVGPLLEDAFRPLVERGFLRFAYGGKEVGEYLVSHALVDSIHLTGSADTFNAIVWGALDAPRTGKPRITKHITAELGNVTPFIVVPGMWSDKDLKRQVKSIVTGLMHNAGHNCLAAEVVVTAADWPLREKFLVELQQQLGQAARRVPYYPGSAAKLAAFRQRMAGHQVLELGRVAPQPPQGATEGDADLCPQPWLLVPGLTPQTACVRQENWCGVLQEVALPGTGGAGQSPVDFLQAACKFANEQCWGSLCCAVICHPRTQKQHREAWNQFLADLRYGSICVNCPTVVGYAITSLPWGGAPGNTLQAVESGMGLVHNTFMFDHAAKGVMHAPWKVVPKALYFMDNYALAHVVPHLLRLIMNLDRPLVGMVHMMRLAHEAVRG